MALPSANRVGDSMLQLKIVAAAALLPGQILQAYNGRAGIVMGLINIPIGGTAVLALDGHWDVDCASGTTASAGDDAFYNTSTGLVVTAGGTNIIYLGAFIKAKTSGQTKATISLNAASAAALPWIPNGAIQAISGPGAVNVTSYLTKITTTGSDAFTLANGVRVGQMKKIQFVVKVGNATLTPTSLSGGTTITFSVVGDSVLLQWNGTAWVMVEVENVTGVLTTPVLA